MTPLASRQLAAAHSALPHFWVSEIAKMPTSKHQIWRFFQETSIASLGFFWLSPSLPDLFEFHFSTLFRWRVAQHLGICFEAANLQSARDAPIMIRALLIRFVGLLIWWETQVPPSPAPGAVGDGGGFQWCLVSEVISNIQTWYQKDVSLRFRWCLLESLGW